MTGLITSFGKNRELLQQFYSPNLILKNTEEDFENLYCFIAKVEPWENELSPPTPSNSDFYLKQLYKNIIAMKKINSNDISGVIERIDWESGVTYYQYDCTEDMVTLDSNGKLQKKFYVRNSYDQVFKCLYNGKTTENSGGIPSTDMPIIDFSINSSSDIIITSDGYKWKYLYSIDFGSKIKFFDNNWIPLIIDTNRKSITSSEIKSGEISVINVLNSGNNYVDDTGSNITTQITISGDGIGANASAVIVDGKVQSVFMNNKGYNYTFATANISPQISYSGNGAILQTSVSPIGGHGFNLLSELGCRNVMITTEFNQSEENKIPDIIDYRQIGLITNPVAKVGLTTEFATSYIYSNMYIITVSPGASTYLQDEIVYQGLNLETATFSGVVVTFNVTNNLLYVINTKGSLNNNELIKGSISNNVRVAIDFEQNDLEDFSGNIVYVENRTKIQRSPSGVELFKLTIKY